VSRLYDALRRVELQKRQVGDIAIDPTGPAEVLKSAIGERPEIEGTHSVKVNASPSSRLVALSDPKSLGAEKFRALVTRLENLRYQRELKSVQITSSVISEGKSLVSANLAVTLARYTKSKVLLIEGDLHRPAVASMLGLDRIRGLGDWWSSSGEEITHFLHQLDEMPLWFLSAGRPLDQPYHLLQSEKFAGVISWLALQFDWIVVDSTPMLPTVDANLWSRLVDGTILVVREGIAPVQALKKGLEGLDNPKLLGIVLNEASEFDQADYKNSYYGNK
jgi:capsular exopolysaccharide synthesis family protein